VAKLPNSFNFPDKDNIDMEGLLLILNRMYEDLAEAINSKPDLYQRDVDGQVSDTFLAQGSININLTTDKVEILTNHNSATTVNWVTLG